MQEIRIIRSDAEAARSGRAKLSDPRSIAGSCRQSIAPIWRAAEEPLVLQAAEHEDTFVPGQVEQTRSLLNGRRKPAHLEKFAADAADDVGPPAVQGPDCHGSRRNVEGGRSMNSSWLCHGPLTLKEFAQI